MAQKKKGGLINRLLMGSEKSEGYARASLPSNRWELFWDILKGRIGKLFLINLLILLFFVPLILMFFMIDSYTTYYGSLSGFNQNIGVGYPAMPEMTGLAESIKLTVNQQFLLFMPICLIIAAVGVSGGAYVMRNMVWTEGIFVANDFWKGVKQNFSFTVILMLIFSLIYYVMQVSFAYGDVIIAMGTGNSVLIKIIQVVSYVVIAFLFILISWGVTMGVTYELKFFKLIKNAFWFTIGLLPLNLFFMVLSILPFIFMFMGTFFSGIGIFIIAAIGFSWFLLVWTNYSHWAFDRFVNDKVKGAQKYKGMYEKVSKNDAESIKKYKEQLAQAGATRSTLSRRPIKPITDDEIQLAELPQSYSRADLIRLQESREAMIKDNEAYVEEHKNDPEFQLTEEEKKLEAEREQRKEEARLALEGKKPPKKKKKK